MKDAEKRDKAALTPFDSASEAMQWLENLTFGEVAGWRAEIHQERGLYMVRAYRRDQGGWHAGHGKTLIEALAWLRHGIENTL